MPTWSNMHFDTSVVQYVRHKYRCQYINIHQNMSEGRCHSKWSIFFLSLCLESRFQHSATDLRISRWQTSSRKQQTHHSDRYQGAQVLRSKRFHKTSFCIRRVLADILMISISSFLTMFDTPQHKIYVFEMQVYWNQSGMQKLFRK